jgi:tetratricopeptide (TPR) repeat protein
VDAGVCQPVRGEGGELWFSFQDLVRLRNRSTTPAEPPRTLIAPPASPARETQIAFDFGRPTNSRERTAHAVLPGPDEKALRRLQDAEDWFRLGCDLERHQPVRAREAYRRAVELNPLHPDAQVNLGRLLHLAKDASGAERHYRAALEARPRDAIAAYNLGTALEDLGRTADAFAAYSRAIEADAGCADAYFNLARLCERAGRRAEAFRHLRAYRQLSR